MHFRQQSPDEIQKLSDETTILPVVWLLDCLWGLRDLRFDNVPFRAGLILLQSDCLAGILFPRKSLIQQTLCKHCLRSMKLPNYGRIVTIGSRGAVQPGANLAAYCASKAAVVALTQAIAEETKQTNITANVVLPSIIDTPGNREAMGEANAKDWVSPQSLAEVICFLAGEGAKDLRGAAIPVYGSL